MRLLPRPACEVALELGGRRALLGRGLAAWRQIRLLVCPDHNHALERAAHRALPIRAACEAAVDAAVGSDE